MPSGWSVEQLGHDVELSTEQTHRTVNKARDFVNLYMEIN